MAAEPSGLAPPAWQRVLKRVHVLSVVAVTGEIAKLHPQEQQAADRMLQELQDAASWDGAEQEERALLQTPVRRWTRQQAVDATWRYEGLAVLAWWIGRLRTLPPVDQQIDAGVLVDSVTPYADVVAPLVASPYAPQELELLATQLLTAHWRLREFQLLPSPLDLPAVVRQATFAPLTTEGLPLAEDDLAVGGEPLSRADDELVQLTRSTAAERRLAVAWLRGEEELYSEGPLDT